MKSHTRTPVIGIVAAALSLLFITVGALSVGAYHIPPAEVLYAFAARVGLVQSIGGINDTVIFDIRLTRIVLAIAVGAALSCSGVVYQGVFRNPLVEPYILGVSSGAAFGAGLAVVFRFPFSIQLLAFVFGLVAVGMTYRLAIVRGQTPTITLVLSGVIIGSLFSALFAIFQYIGTTEQLRRLVFWILGGLHRATWSEVRFIAPVVLVGVAIIWRYAWWLNVLTLGDDEARALGVPVE
ncbi:MAG: iron ABC transporter permease, partial [Spirochaetaceae bacterium]